MSSTVLPLSLLIASAALLSPHPAQGQQTFDELLRDQAGFSEVDLSSLRGGVAVVKVPDAGTDREVLVLGVVAVDVPAEYVVERLRHIETLIAGGQVAQQIGRFGEPPSIDDMAGFSFPDGDVRALRVCRPGDCDVKLPAAAMEEIRSRIDWSAKNVEEQASRAMRRWLFEYLNRYRREGDSALAVYDDKSEPLSVAEGFDILLRESALLLRYWPALQEYLERFPDGELEGAEAFYYWSVEDFGLKPVTHIYHTTVHRPPGPTALAATLARKQIYASHYFQAAVTFIGVVDGSETDRGSGTYLTMLTRKRFDGKLGGLRRALLERRLRENMNVQLEDVQRRLEDSYLASSGGG